MGTPQVKFGDSLVLLQHWDTRKWLGMNVSCVFINTIYRIAQFIDGGNIDG